jgi:hypothetical protein
LGSLDDRGDHAQDLPCARMLDIELNEPGEPFAQIAVKGDFDHRQALDRRNNHQVVERLTAVGAKQTRGKLPRVGTLLTGLLRAAGAPRALFGERAARSWSKAANSTSALGPPRNSRAACRPSTATPQSPRVGSRSR